MKLERLTREERKIVLMISAALTLIGLVDVLIYIAIFNLVRNGTTAIMIVAALTGLANGGLVWFASSWRFTSATPTRSNAGT